MTPDLLILEDDPERIARFVATADRMGLTLKIWTTAREMLAEVQPYYSTCKLMSLDHDPALDLPADAPEPGDGLEVVKWLVQQPIKKPVILHTSNFQRGDWMEGELELAGWRYRRVLPIGDDWIEQDWRRLARKLTCRSRR